LTLVHIIKHQCVPYMFGTMLSILQAFPFLKNMLKFRNVFILQEGHLKEKAFRFSYFILCSENHYTVSICRVEDYSSSDDDSYDSERSSRKRKRRDRSKKVLGMPI
jgi:hypothetical protein